MLKSVLIEEITANLGSRTDLTEARVTRWLNQSMRELANLYNWRSLQDVVSYKTVVDVHVYPIPERLKTIKQVKYLRDGMSSTLEYILPEHYDDMFPDPSEDGGSFPKLYSRFESELRIYPAPSSTGDTLEITCIRFPIEFDTTNDIENPLDGLDTALICMVSAYGCTILGDWEKMYGFSQMASTFIRRARRNEYPDYDYTPVWGSVPKTLYRTPGTNVPAAEIGNPE